MNGTKRKSAPSYSNGQAQSKRYRPSPPNYDYNSDDDGNTSKKYNASARLDPETGQRGAFPGLDPDDGAEDEQLFYGPADDGLQYLRMVRSEAKTVPRVLVAEDHTTSRSVDETDLYREQTGGWYSDGAYTGAAQPSYDSPVGDADDEEELDPQEECYKALLARFDKFRAALSRPPANTSPAHSSLTATKLPDAVNSNVARAQAEYCFKKTSPTAWALATASQDDIMLGLSRLKVVLKKTTLVHEGTGKNLSAWAWVLLAKCRGVGEMNSDEISVLRDLARATLVVAEKIMEDVDGAAADGRDGIEQERMDAVDDQTTEADVATKLEGAAEATFEKENAQETIQASVEASLDSETGNNGISMDVEDLLNARKAELMQQVSDDTDVHKADEEEKIRMDSLRKQALATIDIVVTIIGEAFGQRDLLARRQVWS